MKDTKEFEACLPDIEGIMPQLSEIIGAKYTVGDFDKVEDSFIKSGKDVDFWHLAGVGNFEVIVKLEKYEGYLFIRIKGSGSTFEEAKEYLDNCYIGLSKN